MESNHRAAVAAVQNTAGKISASECRSHELTFVFSWMKSAAPAAHDP
jgi:hypothetical protein